MADPSIGKFFAKAAERLREEPNLNKIMALDIFRPEGMKAALKPYHSHVFTDQAAAAIFLHSIQMRILFLFLFAASCAAFAQESLADISRSIKTVKAETEREKGLMQAEAKRHAAFLEASKQKTEALDAQEKSLKAQIDSLKIEVENLKNSRARAIGAARGLENRKSKYGEDLASAIDSLALFVEHGFPYKNAEAVASLTEISSQLRKGAISPEAAFGRAWEAMMERVRLGYSAETWNGNLEFEGKTIAGKFFRYGFVSSVFLSQNGETVLWLNSKSGKWESAGENFALRSALKETMRVAEGKTAPKLSLIPVLR